MIELEFSRALLLSYSVRPLREIREMTGDEILLAALALPQYEERREKWLANMQSITATATATEDQSIRPTPKPKSFIPSARDRPFDRAMNIQNAFVVTEKKKQTRAS